MDSIDGFLSAVRFAQAEPATAQPPSDTSSPEPFGGENPLPEPSDGERPLQEPSGGESPLQEPSGSEGPLQEPSGGESPLPDASETPAESAPVLTPDAAQASDQAVAQDGGLFSSIVDSVTGFIDLGGPVVAVLLLLSLFALTIILLKLWQFARDGRVRQDVLAKAIGLWHRHEYDAAIAQVEDVRGPVARVLAYTMAATAAHRNETHVREETEHLALSEISSFRSFLRGLEAVAQVAPLLGLFGTVLGMIEAFQTLEAAGSQVNPADLAGGIWVALLTTAVGLAIAMPVSLILHWFEGRIDRIGQAIELFVTEILTHPPAASFKLSADKSAKLSSLTTATGVARAA